MIIPQLFFAGAAALQGLKVGDALSSSRKAAPSPIITGDNLADRNL